MLDQRHEALHQKTSVVSISTVLPRDPGNTMRRCSIGFNVKHDAGKWEWGLSHTEMHWAVEVAMNEGDTRATIVVP